MNVMNIDPQKVPCNFYPIAEGFIRHEFVRDFVSSTHNCERRGLKF